MQVTLYDFQVSDGVWCDVEVEFHCSSPGYRGDYFTEPDGPEFEITEFRVIEAWGTGWTKHRSALIESDWLSVVEDVVLELLDDYPDLYELQYDAYMDY